MRTLYLFLLFSVFCCNNIFAQIGIKAGVNFWHIDTKGSQAILLDEGPGFHFGIIGEFSLGEKYAIETGPLATFKALPYDPGGGDGIISRPAFGTFIMLEVPILLKRFVNLGEIPVDFSAGPTFSYADDFSGFYAGLQFGSGMQINDFHVSVYYQINLSPLQATLYDVGQQSLYGSNYGLSIRYDILMKGKHKD